jgi:tellurite resistance protein TehA-like permease
VFFFLLNIVLFVFNVTMISLRFYFYPATFLHSLTHPTESLFIPASVISLGTILMNISQYGLSQGRTGEWLLSTMVVMFWIYCGLAVVFSCGIYLVLWSTQTFTV